MTITVTHICNEKVVMAEFENQDEAPEALGELLVHAFDVFGHGPRLEIGGMTPNFNGCVAPFALWAKVRVSR